MTELDTTKLLLEMAQSNATHIKVLNREMGEVVAQVEFLVKFFWIITTASVGAFVASLWSLLLHKKRNGNNTNK